MSTRSKKRRSTVRSYETATPKPKQSFLRPRDCVVQRVSKTPTPASISKKREVTLTQIGYVVYQVSEDMDLNYDDDAIEDREEIPRARKRRKIGKGPAVPVTRQTRSSARRAAERTLKEEEDEEIAKLESTENRIQPEEASKTLMPPPKTPQSTRRKEVPSSQSPVDTPLSAQSQKSKRDLSRSPLKERSTNVRRVSISDWSARKSVRWAPMLEVADSTELEDEESQPSRPAPEMTSSIPIKYELTKDSTRTSGAGPTLPGCSVEVPACSQQQHLGDDIEGPSVPTTQTIKSEVSDSEADEEDAEDFGDEIATQEALGSSDTQMDDPNTKKELIPITDTWTPRRVLNALKPFTSFKHRDLRSEHSSINVDRESNISATSFTSTAQSSYPQLRINPITPQRPKRAIAPSLAHCAPSSEPGEVSIQLTHDLHSHTQTRIMPETESQFENAWHEYEPALHASDEDRDSSQPDESGLSNLTPRALDSEALERNLPSDEPQLPILPPSTALPLSNLPKQHPSSTAAIPRSETTTDETTQPSSAHASSQTRRSPSPSRPPASFAFSSSPLQSRAAAANAYAGNWDGVPLTESQLFPDSLMNETLVGPPSLVGDDWELEGEG